MRHSDEEIEQAAQRSERVADQLNPGRIEAEHTDDLRAITSVAESVRAGETQLREAVETARAQGRSWNRIALVLGVSRQAARQRFADKVGG